MFSLSFSQPSDTLVSSVRHRNGMPRRKFNIEHFLFCIFCQLKQPSAHYHHRAILLCVVDESQHSLMPCACCVYYINNAHRSATAESSFRVSCLPRFSPEQHAFINRCNASPRIVVVVQNDEHLIKFTLSSLLQFIFIAANSCAHLFSSSAAHLAVATCPRMGPCMVRSGVYVAHVKCCVDLNRPQQRYLLSADEEWNDDVSVRMAMVVDGRPRQIMMIM